MAAAVEQAIRADTARAGDPQPWVRCEPPRFVVDADGTLAGASKLTLFPAADELPEAEAAERDDLRELVRRLEDWSLRYAVTWRLSLMNHPVGQIRDGRCDNALFDAIEIAGVAASKPPGLRDNLTGRQVFTPRSRPAAVLTDVVDIRWEHSRRPKHLGRLQHADDNADSR